MCWWKDCIIYHLVSDGSRVVVTYILSPVWSTSLITAPISTSSLLNVTFAGAPKYLHPWLSASSHRAIATWASHLMRCVPSPHEITNVFLFTVADIVYRKSVTWRSHEYWREDKHDAITYIEFPFCWNFLGIHHAAINLQRCDVRFPNFVSVYVRFSRR